MVWMLLLVSAGGALWLPGLDRRGLWTSGEARAAQVARRMVEHDDFVTLRQQMREPHLTVAGTEGQAALTYDAEGPVVVHDPAWRKKLMQHMSHQHLRADTLLPEIEYRQRITIHKPVFYYWLIAWAHKAGMDVDNFTVRCFSTVPAMFLLAATYLLGCVLYERRVGILAAICLATCVQFWWQARLCQMDMLLALMMTVVFGGWYVADRTERPAVRFAGFLVVYLTLAAATLLKSFAYVLLAGLIVLVFLVVETLIDRSRPGRPTLVQRIGTAMKRMHFFGGLALYLLLVLPWFVLIHRETDGQFTRIMFGQHMFSRAGLMSIGRAFDTKTDAWFYFARMCVDMFPWVIMIPGAMVQVFRPRSRDTRRPGGYLLVWFAIWLAFFSAMPYRKGEYILPLYPAAMILVAKMLVDFVRDQAGDVHLGRAVRLAFVGLGVGMVLAGGFAFGLMNRGFFEAVVPEFGTNKNDLIVLQAVADLLRDHLALTIPCLALLIGLIVAAATIAHRRRTGPALGLLAAGTATAMLLATHLFMDRLIDARRTQVGFARLVDEHARRLAPGEPIILFATEQHELVYRMPDRFDSVPGVDDNVPFSVNPGFMLQSRLAAATSTTLIVMERELWQFVQARARNVAETFNDPDPWITRIAEIPLDPGDDYHLHREPLALLRFDPQPPPRGESES